MILEHQHYLAANKKKKIAKKRLSVNKDVIKNVSSVAKLEVKKLKENVNKGNITDRKVVVPL